jgi:hypothetical protein
LLNGLFRYRSQRRELPDVLKNKIRATPLSSGTLRVTTGRNGEDGRSAILPVSACDTNASVRANI